MTQFGRTIPAPTPQPQAPAPPLKPDGAAQIWMASVLAPWAQNVGGAVGVGVLALIISVKGFGTEIEQSAEVAIGVAGMVFGLAMAVRCFRDEWGMIVARWGERADLAVRAELIQQLENAQARLEELERDGTLRDTFEAQRNALQLLSDHYRSHYDISRSAAMGRGMSRTAWENATALLLDADVLRRTSNNRLDVVPASLEAAWAAVLSKLQVGQGHYVRTADGGLRKTS